MEPENNYGNIEYKRTIINKPLERIRELVTQMRFRCTEGNGECIYVLGVDDDGTIRGMDLTEFNETIQNINDITSANNYSFSIISKTLVKNDKYIYEVLIREINDQKYIDIKIGIAGSVDASKSTFVGTLTSGQLDNGRGLSRMGVFNYIHEVKSGRTSSISHEILGFDHKSNIVNYQGASRPSWPDIVQRSSKIISFFDFAGHEKYLKTTILGLSSSLPNICIIMIAGNNGISKITKEHIFLCLTLKIPFVFVISKIDLCKDRQNVLEETIDNINKLLKHPSVRRLPIHIKNNEDIILSVKNIYSNSVVPIFKISNVTGEGLDFIRTFLNILGEKPKNDIEGMVELYVDNIFNVKGVGIVLGGHLLSGNIKVGDTVLIGPKDDGTYDPVIIKSLHCKKVNVQYVSYGSYICVAFKKIDKKIIRKGLVLISTKSEQLCVRTFLAEITVMRSNSTTIKVGYEPILCCHSIRQVTTIIEIANKKNSRRVENDDLSILRTNDTATIKLFFKYRPEYIKHGSRFLLCEGNLKIVGIVM